MSCGAGHRCGLDLVLLWLWLAAVALIRSLAWEPLYAMGAALKSKKKKKESNMGQENNILGDIFENGIHQNTSTFTTPSKKPVASQFPVIEVCCHSYLQQWYST